MVLSLFLTSRVSNICCFSVIVVFKCEAILSAIFEASFNCLILFIVSVDNFLLIDVSFSNLLIAVSDKVVRSSFFVN